MSQTISQTILYDPYSITDFKPDFKIYFMPDSKPYCKPDFLPDFKSEC